MLFAFSDTNTLMKSNIREDRTSFYRSLFQNRDNVPSNFASLVILRIVSVASFYHFGDFHFPFSFFHFLIFEYVSSMSFFYYAKYMRGANG